ncbi:DUF4262 domain-containing protein [Cereibacter sp. SYSU M97828]|nr:DUF4262 domain-containing protein [Cereibacter flavus]
MHLTKSIQKNMLLCNIRDYGFSNRGFWCTETKPIHFHTAGIEFTAQAPELLIIGLSEEATYHASHVYYRRVKAGERFEENTLYKGFIEGYSVMFGVVPKERYEEWMWQMPWLYNDNSYRVLQLVYPFEDGTWPWEGAALEMKRKSQPLVCATPTLLPEA